MTTPMASAGTSNAFPLSRYIHALNMSDGAEFSLRQRYRPLPLMSYGS
jgi:hypothetical protein